MSTLDCDFVKEHGIMCGGCRKVYRFEWSALNPDILAFVYMSTAYAMHAFAYECELDMRNEGAGKYPKKIATTK